MKPELSRKLDEELRAKQKEGLSQPKRDELSQVELKREQGAEEISEFQINNIRDNANNALELTKGFTPEQRKVMGNWITELELLVGHILYLTANSRAKEITYEEMNQKAIEYGKLKQERRSDMLTDYDVSEAEIDFLRGENAMREWYRNELKK